MTVREPFSTGPMAAERKIRAITLRSMMCPASMFAKSRIIREKGLVNMPRISMTGMMGMAFRKIGTSGQRMSFQ